MKRLSWPDGGLLLLRVISGLSLILFHGWVKLSAFEERIHSFSDPIGLGGEISFVLVLIAEMFCPLFLIAGFKTRFALIPVIFNFIVIVFIAHSGKELSSRELPILYLTAFLALFFTGPGKYSIDGK
ncbi:MAG: DoxX family protein [Bacteroidia bacterium]|nr:DoxX family protein [Bacteroidia bacterium]